MHAYGTNGIITEVEFPLDAAYDWVDVIVGFDDYMRAVAASPTASPTRTGCSSRRSPPSPRRFPTTISSATRNSCAANSSVVLLMVAPHALEPFLALAAREKAEILYRSDTATEAEKKGLPPVFELTWNHTTLARPARRSDHHLSAGALSLPDPCRERRAA